jgi:hypothetical protein
VLPAVALIHIPHHRNVEGEGKRSEEEEEEEGEEDDDDPGMHRLHAEIL